MESEFEFIEWIARQSAAETPEGILRSIGDDCALIRCGGDQLAVTQDILVENVDFRRSWMGPYFLGRKALAVNLSDLAAMGARPLCCLLGLSLPADLPGDFHRRLVAAFIEAGREFGCPLVGGDLSASAVAHVSVTALGTVQGDSAILRAGAKAGDSILVAGPLGLSRIGLGLLERGAGEGVQPYQSREDLRRRETNPFRRACLEAHLDPLPLVEVGSWLASRRLANAMIDVSDGLAADLSHLARASGLAAEIDADKLKLLPEASNETMTPDAILNGGEDYALLFTASKAQLKRLREERPAHFPPFCEIGRVRRGSPALFLRNSTGRRQLRPKGFDHFR